MKTYKRIAQLIAQNKNCAASNNIGWMQNSKNELLDIAKNQLPSGSGIDCGTKIDIDASNGEKIVLLCEFHHMNDSGYYDGWTSHKVIITPSLQFEFDIKITGRDRNRIKEYLIETYSHAMQAEIELPAAKAD